MARAKFKALPTSQLPGGSDLLDRIVGEIERGFASIGEAVDNDRVVGPVLIGTGDTLVSHGLRVPFRYFEVLNRNANAVVYLSPTTNTRPELVAILRASAPVTVSLRFS